MLMSHWMTSLARHTADPSEPYQLCAAQSTKEAKFSHVFCVGLVATNSTSDSVTVFLGLMNLIVNDELLV